PSSSGPRWTIAAHIRRRVAGSTLVSFPNCMIPVIPHIYSYFLLPRQSSASTSAQISISESSELAENEPATDSSEQVSCCLPSRFVHSNHCKVALCEMSDLPWNCAKLASQKTRWSTRPSLTQK